LFLIFKENKMIRIEDLNQLDEFKWEIPKSFSKSMNVPVHLYASRRILESVANDRSLEQAVNVTSLPGLVGQVVVMPDMHQGYGFPIGGVAATRFPTGVISPGGIGYDINCGVRLLGTNIGIKDSTPFLQDLAYAISDNCPSGVGVKGKIRLNSKQLNSVLLNGSKWALKNGYANEDDVICTENEGRLEGVDPGNVSERALKRGLPQLGSLGAGNHFIEVDVVDEILDEEAAEIMGLQRGNLAVQIHCGSRGFGHQVCSDYVRSLQGAVHRFGIELPDRELVCAPLDSPEGEAYLSAMRAAANYAFANRQVLTHYVRLAFEQVLAGKVSDWDLHQVYDIAHNIGKVETHLVEGKKIKVCVHRKGATRAFGKNSSEIPVKYREIGQPVLIPGSMGTSSWVLTGTEENMQNTFGSSSHGAGRVMSRKKAKKLIRGDELHRELEKRGIIVKASSLRGLAEEAPQAYKDVDEVVRTVSGANIGNKVARLKPLVVIKG
jgi:tRNA-splicing ligase RtcB